MPNSPGKNVNASRGQSSVIGFILILGFALALTVTIVTIGSIALSDAKQTVEKGQAEQAMTQLSARTSLVALGDSGTQRAHLGGTGNGQVMVDSDAGEVTILVVNDTSTETIAKEPLGAVLYQIGETTFAYQGGGVWRNDGNGGTMVSPPEYHYHDRTLTFPIVRVTGDEWSGSSNNPFTVKSAGDEQLFPTTGNTNPLGEGHVHVEVTSEFHQGWKTFFETRTEGVVTHDPENQSVSVNLTVPVTETFDKSVTATAVGSDAIDEGSTSPHGGFSKPTMTGANRPTASPKVDAQINGCASGGCMDLAAAGSNLENGTYYHDGDITLDDTNYDTSDGDIHIVVNGDLEFDGSGGGKPGTTTHHEITGDGMVRFYVNGSVRVSGNTGVNTGGDASNLLVMLHSDGGDVATASGTPQFTGLIYAPNASLTINGGGDPNNDNIVGAVVVRDATANGNGNIEYSHVEGVAVDFDPIDTITYLHVSKNRVEFESE